jgi:hypothetical protein
MITKTEENLYEEDKSFGRALMLSCGISQFYIYTVLETRWWLDSKASSESFRAQTIISSYLGGDYWRVKTDSMEFYFMKPNVFCSSFISLFLTLNSYKSF